MLYSRCAYVIYFAPLDCWPTELRRQDEKQYLIIRENTGPRQTKFTDPATHLARKVGLSGRFSKMSRLMSLTASPGAATTTLQHRRQSLPHCLH